MTVQRLTLDNFPQPADAMTLSPNGRAVWQARLRVKKRVETHVALAAVSQWLQPLTPPVVAQAHWVFPQRRKRDLDNLGTGVMKVVVDTLVRLRVLAADDAEALTWDEPTIDVLPGQRRLILTLTSPAEAAR